MSIDNKNEKEEKNILTISVTEKQEILLKNLALFHKISLEEYIINALKKYTKEDLELIQSAMKIKKLSIEEQKRMLDKFLISQE